MPRDCSQKTELRRQLRTGVGILFAGMLLGFGQAAGQSHDRTDSQVTREFGKPVTEDFVEYLRETNLYRLDKKPAKQVKDPAKYIAVIEDQLGGKVSVTKEVQLLLQLAELYRQAADEEQVSAVAAYEKGYEKWLSAADKDKKPVFSQEKQTEYLLGQIKNYRILLQKYPKFEKRPEIIFNLALGLVRVKSSNAAIYLGKLEKEFPKSRWVHLARLTSGEMMFAENKFTEALKFYNAAQESKNKTISGYATYKAGWVEVLLGSKNAALREAGYDKLRKTAALPGSKKDSRKILVTHANQDLIWMWSETLDENRAKQFFVKNGIENFYSTLERMAWKFETAKQSQQAISVYSKIVTQAPLRSGVLLADRKLLQLYLEQNNLQALAQTIERMNFQYGNKGPWHKANAKRKPVLDDAENLLKGQSFTLANKLHDMLKGGDKLAIDPALRISLVYLTSFPKGVEAYLLQYRYAAALEAAGRSEEAATQYLAVAKSNELKSRYRQSASQKMIAVQSAFVNSLKLPVAPLPGTLKKELKIRAPQLLLTEIIDTFTGFYPTDKNIPSYLFAAGRIASDYGHYETAIKRLDKLIQTYPATKEAVNAVKYITSVHLQRGDWTDLIAVSRGYLGKKYLIASGDSLTYLRGVLRTGMWETAVEQYKKKELLTAASSYRDFQKEFPQDKDADKALAFATTIFLENGKGPDALSTGLLLVKTYPRSTYRPDVLIKVADVSEQMLDFSASAVTYETFASWYPTDKRASAAMGKAVLLYLESDKPVKAAAILAPLTQKYSKSEEARTAQLRYAEFREGNDEFYEASIAWDRYAQLVRTDSEDDYWYSQAKAAALLTQVQEGRESGKERLMQMMGQFSRLPVGKVQRARTVVASYFMRILDEKMMDFSGLDINYQDKAEYTRTSTAIKNQLTDFERQQKTIVAIGSLEQTPAAYFKLALCYEMAVRAFDGAPISIDHSKAEVHAIDSMKEQSIFAYKDLMQKTYEIAFKTAGSGGQYNEWRILAHRKLAKIDPKKYLETPEMVLLPQYTEIHLSKPKAGH